MESGKSLQELSLAGAGESPLRATVSFKLAEDPVFPAQRAAVERFQAALTEQQGVRARLEEAVFHRGEWPRDLEYLLPDEEDGGSR